MFPRGELFFLAGTADHAVSAFAEENQAIRIATTFFCDGACPMRTLRGTYSHRLAASDGAAPGVSRRDLALLLTSDVMVLGLPYCQGLNLKMEGRERKNYGSRGSRPWLVIAALT